MSGISLGHDFRHEKITLFTCDDGSCFIEVEDTRPPWYEDNEWAYRIEIPIDPEEAKKFWLDFNCDHFKKNRYCTMNPCSHPPLSYIISYDDSDSES